jgi:hypothetical protein
VAGWATIEPSIVGGKKIAAATARFASGTFQQDGRSDVIASAM